MCFRHQAVRQAEATHVCSSSPDLPQLSVFCTPVLSTDAMRTLKGQQTRTLVANSSPARLQCSRRALVAHCKASTKTSQQQQQEQDGLIVSRVSDSGGSRKAFSQVHGRRDNCTCKCTFFSVWLAVAYKVHASTFNTWGCTLGTQ